MVMRVTTETLPELRAPMRVQEKDGFVVYGKGEEESVIRFKLPKKT